MKKELILRLHLACRAYPPDTRGDPVQLLLRGDPWRVAVACALLNQTSIAQARPALARILELWPGPEHLMAAEGSELGPIIEPLGFGNRRADLLRRMSADLIAGPWRTVDEVHGIGPYAVDAVRIFCLGERGFRSVGRRLDEFLRRPEEQPPELSVPELLVASDVKRRVETHDHPLVHLATLRDALGCAERDFARITRHLWMSGDVALYPSIADKSVSARELRSSVCAGGVRYLFAGPREPEDRFRARGR